MKRDRLLRAVGRYPGFDLIVCVQCRMRARHGGDADEWGTLGVELIAATVVDVSDGAPVVLKTQEFSATADYWTWLYAWSDVVRRLAVMTAGARDHCSALGLWDRIAAKTLLPAGLDPRDGSSSGDGCIILSDPPTVVCFGRPGQGDCITWLDPANYGATFAQGSGKPHVLCGNPAALSAEVAAWVRDYIGELRTLRLNELQHTAASQGMAGLRYGHWHHDVYVHSNQLVKAMERDALYGGRCEARYIGSLYAADADATMVAPEGAVLPIRSVRGSIYHLDVNSLYPSVAAHWPLPTRLMAACRECSVGELSAAVTKAACVATVTVRTDVPCLPYRHDGEVIYPIGEWTGTYTAPELAAVLVHGEILACHALAVYESQPIYADMVRAVYARRATLKQEGNRRMTGCLKQLLNASFAKWAQRRRRWVDEPDVLPPMPYCQWWGPGGKSQYRSIGWRVQREHHYDGIDAECADNCPAITATINALGRVRLWWLIQCAGPGHVYYYDTDSLICDQHAYDRLSDSGEIDDHELGRLSVRGEHQHVRIIGRQAYECDGVLTLSGTADPHVREGETHAKVLRSPPIQHWLLRSQPPGIDRMVCRVRKDRGYRHGKVQPDGTVLPLRVDDDRVIVPG